MTRYEINEESLQDLINIEVGLFYPLKGFMDSKDYHSVVNNLTLSDGSIWTIPITLDVDESSFQKAIETNQIILTFRQKEVALLNIEDFYKVDNSDIEKVYKTNDINHPSTKGIK